MSDQSERPAERDLVRIRGSALDLIRALFDFEFRTIIATRMLPAVYRVAVGAIGVAVAFGVIIEFRESTASGLLWLFVVGPVIFFGLVATLRVFLEVVMSIFRIAYHVENVAGQTEDLVDGIPGFDFFRTWRRGRDPRRAEKASSGEVAEK